MGGQSGVYLRLQKRKASKSISTRGPPPLDGTLVYRKRFKIRLYNSEIELEIDQGGKTNDHNKDVSFRGLPSFELLLFLNFLIHFWLAYEHFPALDTCRVIS